MCRRRVDEHPVVALALGRRDDGAHAVGAIDQRRLVGTAQLVPERQRSLRIGVDQQHRTRWLVGMRGEMRGQRALTRAAFARCEDDDVHGQPLGTTLLIRRRK